ncbi:MAG: S8 family serine peptidase [bacterium]|nr:S8 family serine peptidase [bacterium]
MKKLKLLFSFLCIIFFSLSGISQEKESDFYYYNGNKIFLEKNTQYLYVVTDGSMKTPAALEKNLNLKDKVSKLKRDDVLQSLKKVSFGIKANPESYSAEIELGNQLLNKAQYQTAIASIKDHRGVLFVTPYYYDTAGKKMALTQYFNVKLKNVGDIELLKEYASKNNTEIIGQNLFMPLWYTIGITINTQVNAMEMANKFHESNLFESAEPQFMIELTRIGSATSILDNFAMPSLDTFFNNQWGLKNTGQYGGTPGIDINAENAWLDTKGSPAIKVAVFDEGYEQNHPDLLQNNYGTGYDSDSGTSPSVVWGNHGTACAGIIGAEQDNNLGVTGVSPRTNLISVSINFGSTNYTKLANGLNWSWQNGADIISNSWGGGGPSTLFDNALTNAFTNGRDGLGTIVVFATANSNSGVVYPANSNPNIIAVGAMSMCGERKNPSSCDGETWWGSNFGPTLDVVAPGVKIATTDRQGTAGYSTTDYVQDFNGTSSACPMVSGVAALILAENPCLSHTQVQDIIEQTTQKVRTDLYTYSTTGGRPNGTWNNQMGYGLVDAEAAVNLAQITTPPGSTAFDLYSQDRPDDIGLEPNTISTWFWGSEDMWVRQNLDGGLTHQNPEYKMYSPNGIYVKVRNRGTTTSDCATLKVYFARASTGLTWPTHFINNYAGPLLNGDIIGTAAIPSIPPNGTAIIEIPWYPPNPADYGTNGDHHFCLTSRIVSANDPMYNEANFVNIGQNAYNNNNIIWKNVDVYNAISTDSPIQNVYIRGVDRENEMVNIRFIGNGMDDFDRVQQNFFEVGVMEIEMDGELFRRMRDNGCLDGRGIEIIGENRVMITSSDAIFKNVPLRYDETFTLHNQFRVNEPIEPGQQLLLDVVQENAMKGHYEGGERFVIINDKKQVSKDLKVAAIQSPTFNIVPNPTQGMFNIVLDKKINGTYSVIDIYGNILHSGEINDAEHISINMGTSPTGLYFVKVVSNEFNSIKTLIKK